MRNKKVTLAHIVAKTSVAIALAGAMGSSLLANSTTYAVSGKENKKAMSNMKRPKLWKLTQLPLKKTIMSCTH